jgi:hypothetical protein
MPMTITPYLNGVLSNNARSLPMHHAQLVERVREIVKQALLQHGVTVEEPVCETILIRDGYYCGRCFTCADYRAVWFIEENLIKFFCRDAGLLFSCSAEVAAPPRTGMAA